MCRRVKMRVLVTGATGFVGSHVLRSLQEKELELVAACRDSSRLDPGFSGEVRSGDLRDPDYVDELVQGVDILCHCAAWTALYGHEEESHNLFLKPSLLLIDTAKRAGVKRLINISTTSASSPAQASDARSPGINRSFWPHLNNVIHIENHLRTISDNEFRVINLRLGLFAGRQYNLGLLPILLPRLKTHLVPWVNKGQTSMPIIDGRDIGQAFAAAVHASDLPVYESINIVGPKVPTTREVIKFLHDEFAYPMPHFSVPFSVAYIFAGLMEKIDAIVPWEPLVTRSIIHLLEEVNVDNDRAERLLGYRPEVPWQLAVRAQVDEMRLRQERPMSMASPQSQ
jgi:nucleoside-diphosphate-sugar epimerase